MKGLYNAKTIAAWLINKSLDGETPITNLQLQKLLYFANGLFWFLHKNKLIKEDFEAWQHGPVVPKIYENFKKYYKSSINTYQSLNQKITLEHYQFLGEYFNNIVKKYTAWELVDLSHTKGSPWDLVYHNSDEYISNIIPFELIQNHFSKDE